MGSSTKDELKRLGLSVCKILAGLIAIAGVLGGLLGYTAYVVDSYITRQEATDLTKGVGVGALSLGWIVGLGAIGTAVWVLARRDASARGILPAVDDGQSAGAPTEGRRTRQWIAVVTIAVTVGGITVLAVAILVRDPAQGLTVFNILVPVLASWVGTVLAFYFGRESFESANQQVRELVTTVTELSPEQRRHVRARAIMKHPTDIVSIELPDAGPPALSFADVLAKYSDEVTRLPVVSTEYQPRYMVHRSSIDEYRAEVTAAIADSSTFQEFLDYERNALELGPRLGFETMLPTATLAEVKSVMERAKSVQDVFVTEDGSSDSPILGWISNTRLARYLPDS